MHHSYLSRCCFIFVDFLCFCLEDSGFTSAGHFGLVRFLEFVNYLIDILKSYSLSLPEVTVVDGHNTDVTYHLRKPASMSNNYAIYNLATKACRISLNTRQYVSTPLTESLSVIGPYLES